LAQLLGLAQPPRRIEGFDISHMQGTDTVASMVVFSYGLPDKTSYRKFKMRLAGNDDFAHMAETIKRRLRDENVKKWGVGDLMMIDGGKGQLSAAITARDECSKSLPMFGLAKRQEEIIVHKSKSAKDIDSQAIIANAKKMNAYVTESGDFINIELPKDSHAVKLLQRIRDESHRFAVSYHSTLKRGRQTTSILDEVPGIGPLTRKKLIRHFGSAKSAVNAQPAQLQELLGPQKGSQIAKYFAQLK
jgi:excinuclease ABC subunit C